MIEEMIRNFTTQYPVLALVVTLVGLLRLILKPVMDAIGAYVKKTPSVEDDETFAAFKDSTFYKVFSYLVEYLASLKL